MHTHLGGGIAGCAARVVEWLADVIRAPVRCGQRPCPRTMRAPAATSLGSMYEGVLVSPRFRGHRLGAAAQSAQTKVDGSRYPAAESHWLRVTGPPTRSSPPPCRSRGPQTRQWVFSQPVTALAGGISGRDAAGSETPVAPLASHSAELIPLVKAHLLRAHQFPAGPARCGLKEDCPSPPLPPTAQKQHLQSNGHSGVSPPFPTPSSATV